MKINLHCHSNYSDGYVSLDKMAQEHKKLGFSAFVVTDHCYPFFVEKGKLEGRHLTSYDKFFAQKKELKQISETLNFPCIQGIELALYSEEILVFGNDTIKQIFEFLEKRNFEAKEEEKKANDYHKKLSAELIKILKTNKNQTAIIFCHPRLVYLEEHEKQQLFEIVDGYEFQNSGHYFFTDVSNKDKKNKWNREIPQELKGKKKFYNSDAHALMCVNNTDGNFHNQKIENVADLIKYIKNDSFDFCYQHIKTAKTK